ncbi:hypothetical protein NL108_003476 [Boleophthalmus pectinirostris]|nr:hypothetical protein NL108_003476 [Boleophthalmus pectinirostris]
MILLDLQCSKQYFGDCYVAFFSVLASKLNQISFKSAKKTNNFVLQSVRFIIFICTALKGRLLLLVFPFSGGGNAIHCWPTISLHFCVCIIRLLLLMTENTELFSLLILLHFIYIHKYIYIKMFTIRFLIFLLKSVIK